MTPHDPPAVNRAPLRRRVSLLMALAGALLFAIVLAEDLARHHGPDLPWGLIIRYIVAMALGGALAGWLLARMFGRGGIAGWLLALAGGILALAAAGLFGSIAGLLPDLIAQGWQSGDLIAAAFGAVVLPLAFAGEPLLVAGWLVLLAITHLLAKRCRRGEG